MLRARHIWTHFASMRMHRGTPCQSCTSDSFRARPPLQRLAPSRLQLQMECGSTRMAPSWRGSGAQQHSLMMPRALSGRHSCWRSSGPCTPSQTQSSWAYALPWFTCLPDQTGPGHSLPPIPRQPLDSSARPAGVGHARQSLQCIG